MFPLPILSWSNYYKEKSDGIVEHVYMLVSLLKEWLLPCLGFQYWRDGTEQVDLESILNLMYLGEIYIYMYSCLSAACNFNKMILQNLVPKCLEWYGLCLDREPTTQFCRGEGFMYCRIHSWKGHSTRWCIWWEENIVYVLLLKKIYSFIKKNGNCMHNLIFTPIFY